MGGDPKARANSHGRKVYQWGSGECFLYFRHSWETGKASGNAISCMKLPVWHVSQLSLFAEIKSLGGHFSSLGDLKASDRYFK